MKKRLNNSKSFKAPALIWKRIVAFAIDLIIFDFVVLTFFRKIIINLVPQDKSFLEMQSYMAGSESLITTITLLMFAVMGLAFVYFTYQEYKFRDTIGKRILKITIESETKQPKFWQCMVRNLYWIPLFPVFPLLAIADFISMFTTKDNRRLTELLSKTRTISYYSLEYNG